MNFFFQVEVKTVLGKICKRLPNSVEGTCDEFIDTYGNAIVAILAQEIDPSVVRILFLIIQFSLWK